MQASKSFQNQNDTIKYFFLNKEFNILNKLINIYVAKKQKIHFTFRRSLNKLFLVDELQN